MGVKLHLSTNAQTSQALTILRYRIIPALVNSPELVGPSSKLELVPKPHSHGWAHLKSNWKEPIEPLGTTCSVISFAKDAHAASGQCANKLVPEQQHTLTPDSFTDSLTTLLFAPWQLLPGCWTYELEHVHLVQREREDLLITFHELEPVPSPLFWATVRSDYNKSNRVQTTDAFSLVLVPLYHTFTCSFVLLLLTSNSDSHTFLFQTLI